jgi:hypothetical protein
MAKRAKFRSKIMTEKAVIVKEDLPQKAILEKIHLTLPTLLTNRIYHL